MNWYKCEFNKITQKMKLTNYLNNRKHMKISQASFSRKINLLIKIVVTKRTKEAGVLEKVLAEWYTKGKNKIWL